MDRRAGFESITSTSGNVASYRVDTAIDQTIRWFADTPCSVRVTGGCTLLHCPTNTRIDLLQSVATYR